MKNSKYTTTIVSFVGIILWIIYLFEKEMSNYGIYSLVSYNTHEILSMVPLLSLVVTFIWLILIIKTSITKHEIKSNMIVLIILSALLVIQGGYIQSQSKMVSTSTVAKVTDINPQEETVTIDNALGVVVLECPMVIFKLLEIDQTYLITYQHKKDNKTSGKVNLMQVIEN